jgi:hypothetical protein
LHGSQIIETLKWNQLQFHQRFDHSERSLIYGLNGSNPS